MLCPTALGLGMLMIRIRRWPKVRSSKSEVFGLCQAIQKLACSLGTLCSSSRQPYCVLAMSIGKESMTMETGSAKEGVLERTPKV